MRRVFLLSSDPGPSATAALSGLLAGGLPRDRYTVCVGLVGRGARASTLTGGSSVLIPWRWAFDSVGWRQLRAAVTAFDPDVIHAVGPAAVRLVGLLTARRRGPRPAVVASGVDRPEAGAARWLTRWALRAAARVVARTPAEAGRYTAAGVRADRVVVIPPGVLPALTPPDAAAFRRSLDIPEDGRLVVAAGRFDAAAGLKSAVWAFDVVRYARPDLHLVLVGDGPDRAAVQRFARRLGFDDYRVRFAGVRPDWPAFLGLADVAWVTHERGGVATALEAMAAGVPVVAAGTPDLLSVVTDGVTGRTVPPADRIRLAAVTHDLLGDPAAAGRLAAAGRAWAGAEFPAGRMVERYAAVYDDVCRTSTPA